MKSKLSTLGLVLILGALIFSGCGPGLGQPTQVPEEPSEPEMARDAVLAYISERYDEQAPPSGLTWKAERITPEGLVGSETFQYTAKDWVVTITYPVVAPENVVYWIVVENPTAGFHWEGRVGAAGQVAEGSEMVLTALDAALAYLSEHHAAQAPEPGMKWAGGRATPEGLVGSETYQYTAEDWVITISYPVVAPENVIYKIVVDNPAAGFHWEGELDAERHLKETVAPEGNSQPEGILDRVGARDIALNYICEHYQCPPVEPWSWKEERLTPENILGSETYQYSAGDWVITVSYPVVAPENVFYKIVVANQATGFKWEGEVDALRQVKEVKEGGAGQPPADWQVYVNDDYGYRFYYPATATITEHGVQGFPTDELPEGMSVDDYIAQLQEKYGNKLCIEVKYELGYITISAPANQGFRYATCGRTGVGVGEVIDKSETMVVAGQTYTATGFEFMGVEKPCEALSCHDETFVLQLADGTRIEYGTAAADDATYEDYLATTKDVLLQIVASFIPG